MKLDNKDIHDIKNNLTIATGLLRISIAKLEAFERLAPRAEIDAIVDRINRSITANEKILTFLEQKKLDSLD